MVALSRKELARQNVYFGTRNIKGSKEKIVNMQGFGLIPLGKGMYTFGEYAPVGQGAMVFGSGMALVGTGVFQKIKKIAHPLLKKGREELFKQLQKGAKKGKEKLIEEAKRRSENIKNPQLQKLAQQGIKVGDVALEEALKGNKELSKYKDILKSGLEESKPTLVELGKEQAMKGLEKGLSKVGEKVGILPDDLNITEGLGLSKMQQQKLLKRIAKNRGRGMNTIASRTDQTPRHNTVDYTESNNELTLLKDIIRSKPAVKSSRGSGLYNY